LRGALGYFFSALLREFCGTRLSAFYSTQFSKSNRRRVFLLGLRWKLNRLGRFWLGSQLIPYGRFDNA